MMNYIIGLIGDILGWLMYFCYRVLPDYFISIIVFTFGTKDLGQENWQRKCTG